MLASTPTNILNHKTAKNGIPSDSAKDGNALVGDGGRRAGIDAVSRRATALHCCNGARRNKGACENYQCRTRKKKRD